MKRKVTKSLAFGLLLLLPFTSTSQSVWDRFTDQPKVLGHEQGSIEVQTAEFNIKLLKSSQTIAQLEPKKASGFDFSPGDVLDFRSRNNMYHLGDITLRIRQGESREWKSYSSASNRANILAITPKGSQLAVASLRNTFPADMPLQIIRSWERDGDALVLRFKLTNNSTSPVEIGSLGIPMVFNNILHGKGLDQAHAECVFYDPYIGQDAGYLQVVRLHGQGPLLLVMPHQNAPFEAYGPLLDDPTPKGVTFEGFHEWMIHSRAHAETDWSEAVPWNSPTSYRLLPGESRDYALKFVLSESVRSIETTLLQHKRPVAVGVPGYALPTDVNARLLLNYHQAIRSIDVEPAGALVINQQTSTSNGWYSFDVKGVDWGRARLTITYADGVRQTINYKVIKPEEQVIADMGSFLTNQQWYDNPDDPFGRSPSVMTFDYEKMDLVLEDSRAWIAGLSDEGGAGSWLAAIMKQLVVPDRQELEKLQRFMHETLWGGIQNSEGDNKYGVRKSLFMYEPDEFPDGTYSPDVNYSTWSAWNRKEATSVGRSYNYPHVAAAHWVFYRMARFYNDYPANESWQWYLENAFHTSIAMVEQAPYYAQFGQMEGTIFLLILLDLHREGMTEMAQKLEQVMKARADVWDSLSYPFGSEMPWDSTGQEEVYAWSKYFGYHEKANVTLNAILAYMPTLPHWGYNGSARRYWDFVYAGKLSRIERQLHHYGSGLNAIPVLSEYRENPDDFYLLRVGHAGLMGSIANITREGFAPAAFHSFPSTLRIDGINGDYGPNFFGYSVNSGTYVTNHEEFGWLSFGGNLVQNKKIISIFPTTASRSRLFIAPLGLWLTLDAGRIDKVDFNVSKGTVTLYMEPTDGHTPNALLRIEQPKRISRIGLFTPKGTYAKDRDTYVVPLSEVVSKIELVHK
jgi:hypothetical protein